MASAILAQFRKSEKRIKARTNYYARLWNVSPEDLSGQAKLSFMKAVESYVPSFGADLDTWVVACINTELPSEAKRVLAQRGRFVHPQSAPKKEPSKEHKVGPGPDFWHNKEGMDGANFAERELLNLLENSVSENARLLLDSRMAGYTNREHCQRKLMSRRSTEQASAELRAFAEKEYPRCVK